MSFAYSHPASLAEAADRLASNGARPMGGGTDLLTRLGRGIATADGWSTCAASAWKGSPPTARALRIGATTTVAEVARDDRVAERFAAPARVRRGGCRTAAARDGHGRRQSVPGGPLLVFRHPDLTCWLGGGDTCYAQIGDHRKHGLEPGDCISVAPSDLAAGLLALDARVETLIGASRSRSRSSTARPRTTTVRRSRSSRARS